MFVLEHAAGLVACVLHQWLASSCCVWSPQTRGKDYICLMVWHSAGQEQWRIRSVCMNFPSSPVVNSLSSIPNHVLQKGRRPFLIPGTATYGKWRDREMLTEGRDLQSSYESQLGQTLVTSLEGIRGCPVWPLLWIHYSEGWHLVETRSRGLWLWAALSSISSVGQAAWGHECWNGSTISWLQGSSFIFLNLNIPFLSGCFF